MTRCLLVAMAAVLVAVVGIGLPVRSVQAAVPAAAAAADQTREVTLDRQDYIKEARGGQSVPNARPAAPRAKVGPSTSRPLPKGVIKRPANSKPGLVGKKPSVGVGIRRPANVHTPGKATSLGGGGGKKPPEGLKGVFNKSAVQKGGLNAKPVKLSPDVKEKLAKLTSQKKSLLINLFKNGRVPKASELKQFAEGQGWMRIQRNNGPFKYIDNNGIVRITIKKGSSRTPGSDQSHVELRNSSGQRVDPFGKHVSRKSARNHSRIIYDL